MLFTILIAVHDTARFLPKMLESLLGQTFGDFEAICIDDASTDDSWEVLQAYARRDARIRLLHLDRNVGAGGARNAGLALAQGEYITMLDSDDWYEPDTLANIQHTIATHPKADSIVMRLVQHFEDDKGQPLGSQEYAIPYPADTVVRGFEAFRLSLDWQVHGLYFVRAEIHRAHPYDTSALLYADDNTSHIHYLHSRNVAFSAGTYCYRRHATSMTSHFSMRTFDRLDADASLCCQIAAEIRQGSIDKEQARAVRQICETRRWRNLVDAYWQMHLHRDEISLEETREIHDRIAKALSKVQFSLVERRWLCRPGYLPTHNYVFFRLQAELYFAMRRLLCR